jgi:hypothetical protein
MLNAKDKHMALPLALVCTLVIVLGGFFAYDTVYSSERSQIHDVTVGPTLGTNVRGFKVTWHTRGSLWLTHFRTVYMALAAAGEEPTTWTEVVDCRRTGSPAMYAIEECAFALPQQDKNTKLWVRVTSNAPDIMTKNCGEGYTSDPETTICGSSVTVVTSAVTP